MSLSEPSGLLARAVRIRLWRIVLITATLAATGLVFAGGAGAASGDCDASVAHQAGLHAAIVCFNSETTAGNHVITVTSDFVYTTSVVAIDNSTAGVSLVIDGMGKTVDADGNGAVFTITGSEVSFVDITLTGGNANGGYPNDSGGGISNIGGTVSVTGSTISVNTAIYGGGISNGGLGRVTVTGSTISNNATLGHPNNGGGGIHNNSGRVTVTGSTISNNTSSAGGGIYVEMGATVTVTGSTISGNNAPFGGGIYNSGPVTVTGSTISNNTATAGGGGIHNNGDYAGVTVTGSTISGNNAPFGGGIYNRGVILSVTGSTISGNNATTSGGGIFNNGVFPLTVTGSTISNNTAGSRGGGIYNNYSTVSVWFSTITSNTAPDAAGIWTYDDSATDTFVGASIVADNIGGGGDVDCQSGSCTGNGFTSEGFNVIGDGNATGSFAGVQDIVIGAGAGLGPLQNNGGSTETHLPGVGSPAVDRFNITTGLPVWDQAFDQRGVARPQPVGGFKDAGSVEQRELDGLSLVSPVCGVYDSLMAGDPILPGSGVPKLVQVSGVCGVPAGASAVVVNVTSKLASGVGNLRVSAAGVVPSGGVVNYTSNGLDQSNTVTVPLSAGGALDVAANIGDSHIRVVVVGYYHQAGVLAYSGVAPCTVADSRSGQNPTGGFAGPFSAGAAMPDIDVVGTFNGDPLQNQGGGNTDCSIPEGVTGVVVNIVSIGGTGGTGGIAAGQGGTSPTEPTVNYAPIGLNNAAVTYLLVDGSGKIAVDVIGAGTTHIRIVVLGYLTTAGDRYTPVNPCTAFDSRDTLGSDPDNVPAGLFAGKRVAGDALVGTVPGTTTYNLTGTIPAAQGGANNCGVPDGASAVLINLVAIQPASVGNFRAYATGSTPTGGVLNFNSLAPAVNNANAVVVPLSALGNIDLFVNAPSNSGSATVHARGVILGYYD